MEINAVIYERASLYVMSGTGNTRRAAEWMAEQARSSGAQTRVVNIERGMSLPASPTVGDLVGFLLPTHGFTAPWLAIRVALRFPRAHGTHAFVIATRAGTKLGRMHLPGMEGTAAYLIALILALKGYRVRGAMGLDMPSNWIAVHPGFGDATAADMASRARPWAERFMQRILDGGTWFGWGSFVCLALGLALLPASLGYLVYGRFMLSKLFFADERCNGCGICAANCPVGGIAMWGKRAPRPFWRFRCESCMRCMAFCPLKAIQAGHSWAVLLGWAALIPAGTYVLDRLIASVPWLALIRNEWGERLFNYPYFLGSMALAYYAFSLALRWRPVNALFSHTTLTRIFRRYRAPQTNLSDLHTSECSEAISRSAEDSPDLSHPV